MASKKETKDYPVSARLTEREFELILADVKKRGTTRDEYIRSAILQHREDATKTRLAEIETRIKEQDQTIFELVNAITELRVATARGIRAVLLGNEPDEEGRDVVRKWVRQNMLPEEDDPDTSGELA
tara:strand:+ start:97 stop:477 length:381 start_codon:yes stop_codon:yes gene_type:complete